MKTSSKSKTELLQENAELRGRLEEAEETLRAIRAGEVDALVMSGQVYSLSGAETPYRILVEAMNEIALTLTPDGTVFYCNGRLAELLGVPHGNVIGSRLRGFVASADQPKFDALFAESQQGSGKGDLALERQGGPPVPVQLSLSVMEPDGHPGICAVMTDLTERKKVEAELAKHREHLEELVKERTAELAETNSKLRSSNLELERFNRAMVGRELRMIELKKEINELCAQAGQPRRYPLDFAECEATKGPRQTQQAIPPNQRSSSEDAP
jgi:PAS domain S-box-containing protein